MYHEAPNIRYKVESRRELLKLLNWIYSTKVEYYTDNFNWIDVSNVTDFSYLFGVEFNGDISEWDVSNGTNFLHMIFNSNYSRDLSKWNINKDAIVDSIVPKINMMNKIAKLPEWVNPYLG